jgi:hypothetical protein
LDEDYEIRCWTRELGVTKEELAEIIAKVGNSAAEVRRALRKIDVAAASLNGTADQRRRDRPMFCLAPDDVGSAALPASRFTSAGCPPPFDLLAAAASDSFANRSARSRAVLAPTASRSA